MDQVGQKDDQENNDNERSEMVPTSDNSDETPPNQDVAQI